MKFKRHLFNSLNEWKGRKDRKPLIIRGARQIGKTTLVHAFAETFGNSILLNLEKPGDLRFFEEYDDVRTIKDALFFEYNISNDAISHTLLFLDEIQESPRAIQFLRYFYEEIPELHVIAAGSLLEFAMRNVKSFPVGRVEFLHQHPLNFTEFLSALGKDMAIEQLKKVPAEEFAHTTLIDLFNSYTIIGGMPEVVATYLNNLSIADLPRVYESIWTTYKNDVEKYASNSTELNVIKHIINSAYLYVDQRIKFQNFGNSNYKSREVSEAFRNLDNAKVIQLIYPTTDVEPPLKPDLKKSPRIQFLDTGLVNYDLKIQAELLSYKDLSNAYKGAIIPHIITQEIISLNTFKQKKPNFWVRDKAQTSSEVDLLFHHGDKVIPIEIKSGATGKLRSLHQFIERSNHPYAVRIYAGEFSVENHSTPIQKKPYILMNLPYYLGTMLPEYLEYFVKNY